MHFTFILYKSECNNDVSATYVRIAFCFECNNIVYITFDVLASSFPVYFQVFVTEITSYLPHTMLLHSYLPYFLRFSHCNINVSATYVVVALTRFVSANTLYKKVNIISNTIRFQFILSEYTSITLYNFTQNTISMKNIKMHLLQLQQNADTLWLHSHAEICLRGMALHT